MPLPNTRVIPAGWSAHHRPVVADTWTATVTLRRPGYQAGSDDFDPVTGTRTGTPHPVHFTGTARIQVQPILGGEDVAGDQEITTYGYLVAVDLATSGGTQVGDLVDVTAVDDNGDASLVGRTLTVTGVGRGSLVWERDLYAIDNLG